MRDDASTVKTYNRHFLHRLEHRLIGLGMSVLAYLLEKAVLRSVARGGTRL